MICRDRAGAYAAAARDGAPGAIQCADRWHLWHNLAEHVEKAVVRHRSCLKQTRSGDRVPSEPNPEPVPPAEPAVAEESRLVARIRERHAAVQALHSQGKALREIARELGLDRKTVRRFAHATSADDLMAKTVSRCTPLDAHGPT